MTSAAVLARRLARDAEAVCRHYLSNGRRSGRYWVAGDVIEHPGPQPLCAAHRSRLRSGCCRQMDRCRNGSARRSVGPDPPQSRSSAACARRWTRRPFSWRCPDTSGAEKPRRRPATRPRPPAVCSAPDARSQVRKPKPISALGASPVISIGWRCVFTRGSGTARPRRRPLKPGRHCLPPSPIPVAGSPASSAPGSIATGPTRRRSPIRAAPSVIFSATASVSALPSLPPRKRGCLSPAKASRRCSRSNRCCPCCR